MDGRKALLVASLATAALVTAGTVAYAVGNASSGESPAKAKARPGSGKVHDHALRDLSGSSATAKTKDKNKVLGLPATDTQPFSLIGVTWDKPLLELRGTVKVRSRSVTSGSWSGWRSVETEAVDTPDAKEASSKRRRGGTSGLWVGPSNGVEVRVTGMGRALPAGLQVDLVDPGKNTTTTVGGTRPPRAAGDGETGGDGESGKDVRLAAAAEPIESPTPEATTTETPSATPSPTETPSASASPSPSASEPEQSPTGGDSADVPSLKMTAVTAPKPAIVSRAGWSADESLVRNPPTYDTAVKAAFVHHSATGNNYTCAEAPSVIRSVFLYHVQSQGWDDIGYNFLVDKCGTVYEGRAGGVDRAVHGAHTYGFNTDTTGITVLGTHTAATDSTPGVAPTQASLDAVAKVAAWKLGLSGVDPTAKTMLTSAAPDGSGGKYPFGQEVEFNTISGHRDGFNTACPGEQLQAKLGAIRSTAKAIGSPALAAEVTGAQLVGGRYYTRSTATLGWTPQEGATYEVLVDGTVAARPTAGASSAALTLSQGTHAVKLRATTADGGVAESPAFTVVADTTRPVFSTPPEVFFNRGTVELSSVPIFLGWKVSDVSPLKSIAATSPAVKTFTPDTTQWVGKIKPGKTWMWNMQATDILGNTGSASVSRAAYLVSELSASRSSGWKISTVPQYLGGRGLYSSTKGASVTFTCTCRQVGLIFKTRSDLGKVYVYVDGRNLGLLDTYSSKTLYRQMIMRKTWSSSGKHTVKVVVAGTSGRPLVGLDGMAYIR